MPDSPTPLPAKERSAYWRQRLEPSFDPDGIFRAPHEVVHQILRELEAGDELARALARILETAELQHRVLYHGEDVADPVNCAVRIVSLAREAVSRWHATRRSE